MTTIRIAVPRRALADVLPGRAVRDLVLVDGSAGFVGLSAQVAIPLGFTPVPLTGQTFAVLLAVAAVGPARGLLGMAVYIAAGVARVPWFTQHASEWRTASFGYVVGFLLAAVLGVVPFLIGDAIKVVVATGLLPAAWHLIHRNEWD